MPSCAGEPDPDAVARLGAGDDAADAVVVDARVLAVALAALPLGGRHGPDRAVVDAELQRDGAEGALDRGLDGLRVAPRLREAVDAEVRRRVAHVRHGVRRVGGRLREVEREQQVPAELELDLLLVVLELEPADAGVARLRALGGVAEDLVRAVRVVERVAVGDVQLGRQVGVEPVARDLPLLVVGVPDLVGDRGVDVVTGERREDRIVRGRSCTAGSRAATAAARPPCGRSS